MALVALKFEHCARTSLDPESPWMYYFAVCSPTDLPGSSLVLFGLPVTNVDQFLDIIIIITCISVADVAMSILSYIFMTTFGFRPCQTSQCGHEIVARKDTHVSTFRQLVFMGSSTITVCCKSCSARRYVEDRTTHRKLAWTV